MTGNAIQTGLNNNKTILLLHVSKLCKCKFSGATWSRVSNVIIKAYHLYISCLWKHDIGFVLNPQYLRFSLKKKAPCLSFCLSSFLHFFFPFFPSSSLFLSFILLSLLPSLFLFYLRFFFFFLTVAKEAPICVLLICWLLIT